MRTKAVIALIAAIALTGCSTATPYAPADLTSQSSYRPGYAETQIEDNRFQLTFSGNTLTKRETVETYLLYRAAELTLEKGYDWFEVVSRETDETRRVVGPTYDPYSPFSWRFYHGSRWGMWGVGGAFDESIEYTRYQATAEIVMFKGEKPADNARAYDAHSVKANLESKIVRPTAG